MTWARRHLFGSAANSLLTVVSGAVVAFVLYRLLRFVFFSGRWDIIRRNVALLLVGLFPRDELWRAWLAIGLIVCGAALLAGALRSQQQRSMDQRPIARRGWPLALLVAVLILLAPSIVAAASLAGIVAAGAGVSYAARRLRPSPRIAVVGTVAAVIAAYVVLTSFGGVEPDRWGGFMLTVTLAAAGIVLSFPFGVALALGRRSSLPAIRWFCVGYIELIRGVPLITMLFMGSFVIGFVYPPGVDKPSLVTRSIIALVLFTSAYIAEIVRGGLEAVGRGQIDAARAVGLGPVATTRLIVLPQALRAVIPGLVGQSITLFKDTSLVAIVGLSELLGIARAITSQGEFLAQGLQAETLVFASFVYWTISYTMSKESQALEHRLGVGVR